MTRAPGPEAIFQAQVIELAQLHHWAYYHPPDNLTVAMRSGRTRRQAVVKGFPDLTLVRAPELMFVELKAEKGYPSPEQRDWLRQLRACGVETHLWRPSDLDLIQERLARPRRMQPPIPVATTLGWDPAAVTDYFGAGA